MGPVRKAILLAVVSEVDKGKTRVDAMHIVAKKRDIMYQTVLDHCVRWMGLQNVDEFDVMLATRKRNKN